jgi:hypothetical protein
MQNTNMINVSNIESVAFEAGMIVEQRDEAVLCSLTLGIAAVIGAIF